jgi:hypothetical protein
VPLCFITKLPNALDVEADKTGDETGDERLNEMGGDMVELWRWLRVEKKVSARYSLRLPVTGRIIQGDDPSMKAG